MVAFQDWFHLNIAAGTVFLPLALEASIRLRRRPGIGRALLTGVVLGLAVLVNQADRLPFRLPGRPGLGVPAPLAARYVNVWFRRV
jgi:hypothetical protein